MLIVIGVLWAGIGIGCFFKLFSQMDKWSIEESDEDFLFEHYESVPIAFFMSCCLLFAMVFVGPVVLMFQMFSKFGRLFDDGS